jgi:hypothetical protein
MDSYWISESLISCYNMNDWTEDIENVLEKIRKNSSILSEEHKQTYFRLKNTLQYFRLPLIVISGINSVVSVGMQQYLEQSAISGITCVLSLICSIIGSIELFLAIQKRVEGELISSREYYLLTIDIQKTLLLNREHRPLPAKEYLEKIYNTYIKLTENSNLVKKSIKDDLAEVTLTPPSSPRTTTITDLEWGLSIVNP